MTTTNKATELVRELALVVGDDGTGNLRVVVDEELARNPDVTVAELAEIWRQACADYAAEQA